MEQNISLPQPKDKLWTQSFISACIGNFLLFFAFYLLLPILPLYLIEVFDTNRSSVGIILSCYTLAALAIRPVAGFILDMFSRKPLYLIAYILFVACFAGYTLANLISIFVIVRIMHGLTFGMVTTAGNSLVVDIMPSSRRGEGLGYFGVANNLAMATGPMFSLFLHDFYSFNIIFYIAIGSGLLGFLVASTIKTEKKIEKSLKQPLAFDRFFLPKGLSGGISFMFIAIPYGMLTTYVAIYGKELGIQSSMGIFFSLMAVGLIGSRLFAGKMVDRGKLTWVIACGTIICLVAFFTLSSLNRINAFADNTVLITVLFYSIAVLLGVGYGMLFPAYNTLFVNLAPHNRRATASSTYLTSWDIGVGLGLVVGGRISDTTGGLPLSYLIGTLSVGISILIFKRIAAPHYNKNKTEY
ncbi:MFS transporter [Paludibacter sp. 221]|uniref:MFS transporter n=1 Tax=Paludibacter sp. 221 TaxID=2302939 RepID=UPI0013D03A5D|nr:MFS transporter [Paludibacter sp. 221]NDV47461.1 MFS transporter [Paludibacter sp. 221]